MAHSRVKAKEVRRGFETWDWHKLQYYYVRVKCPHRSVQGCPGMFRDVHGSSGMFRCSRMRMHDNMEWSGTNECTE